MAHARLRELGSPAASRWTALAACALGLFVGGCAEEVRRSSLPISDDFSGECSWSQDDDEHIWLACEGDEYRVLYKRTDEQMHHVIPRRIEEPVPYADVEADVILHAFPGRSDEDFEMHGVGCWSSPVGAPSQGYLFLVAPGVSTFAIVRHDESDEQIEKGLVLQPLVEEQSDAVAPAGRTNRVRGKCRRTENGVELTMYLDEEEVATATDRNGFRPFEAFGFVVISSEAGTDVRFDDFEAEELGK